MGCRNCADIGFVDHDDRPNSFRDQAVRKSFIKKVYLILCVQILMYIGIVCLFVFCDEVLFWVKEHMYVLFVAFGIETAILFVLCCCPRVARTPPYNYILIGIVTLGIGFIFGVIAGTYAPKEVLTALGVTAAVCFVITLFAMQNKYDFTICNVGMIIITLIFAIFTMIAYFFFYDRILRIVVAAIGVTIFLIWLLIDTQMIMGGRLYEIGPNDYIFAALHLYLDIILIFYFILLLWK